jgi:hypothetical protein
MGVVEVRFFHWLECDFDFRLSPPRKPSSGKCYYHPLYSFLFDSIVRASLHVGRRMKKKKKKKKLPI